MTLRSELLQAAQAAQAVYRSSGAKERVEQEGYTRVDPFSVAASEDLFVMLKPMETLLGAFLRLDTPGILINSDRPPGLVRMTCAHEIGHYVLGHQTTSDQTLDYGDKASPVERQADWFAYQLLMPRSLLASLMKRKGWTVESLQDPQTVYQLSLRLGLSFTGTVWSLFRQQMLSSSTAHALVKIQPKRLKQALVGPTTAGNSDVWLLDKADRDLVLEPRSTDQFVVDLPNHVASGFLWSLGDAKDAGFKLSPITIDARHAPKPDPGTVRFGSAQNLRYRLELTDDKMPREQLRYAALDFIESQPWRSALNTDDRFNAATAFVEIQEGLSPQSKAQLIDEVSRA